MSGKTLLHSLGKITLICLNQVVACSVLQMVTYKRALVYVLNVNCIYCLLIPKTRLQLVLFCQ